jgi:hypothetical protein
MRAIRSPSGRAMDDRSCLVKSPGYSARSGPWIGQQAAGMRNRHGTCASGLTGDPEQALGEFQAPCAYTLFRSAFALVGQHLGQRAPVLLGLGSVACRQSGGQRAERDGCRTAPAWPRRPGRAVPTGRAGNPRRNSRTSSNNTSTSRTSRPQRWHSATQASPRGSPGSSTTTPRLQPGCTGTTDARCGPCSTRPPASTPTPWRASTRPGG